MLVSEQCLSWSSRVLKVRLSALHINLSSEVIFGSMSERMFLDKTFISIALQHRIFGLPLPYAAHHREHKQGKLMQLLKRRGKLNLFYSNKIKGITGTQIILLL